MTRLRDLDAFYDLLHELRDRLGGYRYLRDCQGHTGWPERGVYFFFAAGEKRSVGGELRVVRVGTHAITNGSRTTLWMRLSQHKGYSRGRYSEGGNHRGSIFRHHVGAACLRSGAYGRAVEDVWPAPNGTPAIRAAEHLLELDVSREIRNMPFLWLAVPDHAGRDSRRRLIEANAIALLSNIRAVADAPSPAWLGRNASDPSIRSSGLWNVRHVSDAYDPNFLNVMRNHVRAIGETP